jgi:hypothetical protein
MNLPIHAKKNITFAYLSISMQDKTVFFPVWINKFWGMSISPSSIDKNIKIVKPNVMIEVQTLTSSIVYKNL